MNNYIKNSKFNITNTYDHHFGPITSISCFPEYILNNPNENSFDDYNQLESFSQLFLTSSFDSTVKLWNMKVKKRILLNMNVKKFLLINFY